MPSQKPPIASAAILALVALLVGTGCTALAGAPPAQPVIVEGVVVPGDTWRVDPMDHDADAWEGPGLAATITLESGLGERVEVTSDASGRFRAGPVSLSGDDGDRLLVACPGRRGLCLSSLSVPKSATDDSQAPAVVRWRITLPDLAPAG